MIGVLYGSHSYNSEAPRVVTKRGHVFWAIGLLGRIWNAFGCFNFIIQMDPGAVADLPGAYQVLIASRPGWVTAIFFDRGFWWEIGLCFDAAAPGYSAACLVSFLCGRGAANEPCAMGGDFGAWGRFCCNFNRHVFGCGGRFCVVHA